MGKMYELWCQNKLQAQTHGILEHKVGHTLKGEP